MDKKQAIFATREKGFYWVKWADKWEVAEWIGSEWWLPGFDYEEHYFSDINFQEIDERRIINPNE